MKRIDSWLDIQRYLVEAQRVPIESERREPELQLIARLIRSHASL